MTTATRNARPDAKVERGDPKPTIDPRIRARRVEIRRSAGRRRLRLVLAVLAVVALVLVAVGLSFTPLLDVDHITVAGQFRTSPQDIVTAGGIAPGDALVGLDLAAAEHRVEALPWVARADVTRHWPGTVRYRVVERQPVGALKAEDGSWVAVDEAGRVLSPLDAAPADLPVIEGTSTPTEVGAETAPDERGPFRMAGAIPAAARPLIEGVALGADGAISIRLVAGGTVTVGAVADLPAKGVALASVLAAVDPCVATLDLSVASAPVLTRTQGCG